MHTIDSIPNHILNAVNSLLQSVNAKLTLEGLLKSESSSTIAQEKKYLNLSEAITYTGIGRHSLYRAQRKGLITSFKLSNARSGKVLFLKSSIDKWIESCQTKKTCNNGGKNE